jgi:hypothetical protein
MIKLSPLKIIVLIVICALSYLLYYLSFYQNDEVLGTGSSDPIVVSNDQGTLEYLNEQYRFSFKYPAGFNVTTVPPMAEKESEVILIENSKTKAGIQIIISPGPDMDVTEEMIRTDIPDMKILDPQIVEIGLNHKGLAFVSHNPGFGGQSREVWFAYKSHLYQISTYAEFDDLLKKIFKTWTFF